MRRSILLNAGWKFVKTAPDAEAAVNACGEEICLPHTAYGSGDHTDPCDDDVLILWTADHRMDLHTGGNEVQPTFQRKDGGSAEEHSGEENCGEGRIYAEV